MQDQMLNHAIAHAEGKYEYQSESMQDMDPELNRELWREHEEARERREYDEWERREYGEARERREQVEDDHDGEGRDEEEEETSDMDIESDSD